MLPLLEGNGQFVLALVRFTLAMFQQRLLFNSVAMQSIQPVNIETMPDESWLERNLVWIIGLLLALAGGGAIFASQRFITVWHTSLGELSYALGEALIIAGVLSIAVDRPLKARLLKEASRGIFKHMIGFDPQPEIKDELEKIVFRDSKLLCKRRTIRFQIEPLDPGQVRVSVETSVDVETPGATAATYEQYATFERAENATIHRMSLIAPSDANQNYDVPNPDTHLKPPGILEARMSEVSIKPNTIYHFFTNYSMLLPENFYHSFHVAYPTIGVHISVEAPEGFVIEPDQTPHHAGNQWDYPGLYMPGRNVTVRWRRSER